MAAEQEVPRPAWQRSGAEQEVARQIAVGLHLFDVVRCGSDGNVTGKPCEDGTAMRFTMRFWSIVQIGQGATDDARDIKEDSGDNGAASVDGHHWTRRSWCI